MRGAAALCALALAATLRAAGDSADFLLTPYRLRDGAVAANPSTSTITFGGPSDFVADRDGWAVFGERAYARPSGVALRKEGAGTLRKAFAPAERVAYVEVVCGTAATGARGKEASLSLRLADDVPAQTLAFVTPETEDGRTTVTFRLDPAAEADYLELASGPDCGVIFEVARVRWAEAPPPLAAAWAVPEAVTAGETFLCALNALSGGSGAYLRATWRFDGEERTLTGEALLDAVAFQAPTADGTHTVSLEVEDSSGATFAQEIPVRVRPFAPPRAVAADAITRTGFRLTWEAPAPGLTPEAYEVSVRDVLDGSAASADFAPLWASAGEGVWETVDPLGLDAATEGLACEGCVIETPEGWEGTLSVRTDGAAAWQTLLGIGGAHLRFDVEAGRGRTLQVRAEAEAPPAALTLRLTRSGRYAEARLPTKGQARVWSAEGLPPGREVRVSLGAAYRLDDGRAVTIYADELAVALAPIPPLGLANEPRWESLYLTWPAGAAADGLTATLTFRATCGLPQTLPPGLYLTRAYLSGGEVPAGKAIVLTNTTDRDIVLDGTAYTFEAWRAGAAEPKVWDFHLLDEADERICPTVPARGELVLAHSRYLPLEVRPGVGTFGGAALNFTEDYTLTLLRDGVPVNALTPVRNAIVRLPADSLEGAVSHPLQAGLATLPALYDPWVDFSETRTLEAVTLTPDSAYYGYGNILSRRPKEATRIWAEAVVRQGEGRSETVSAVIWEESPRRGFRLRLR